VVGGPLGLAGAEHGQEDVAAAAGGADHGGVLAFAFGSGSAATPPRGDAPARREELHPAYEALASKLG
jgi:hypothetical protein